MSDEPTKSTDDHDDEPETAKPDKARATGLRGLAERHPNVVIFTIVFGSLAGLIALQTCTS